MGAFGASLGRFLLDLYPFVYVRAHDPYLGLEDPCLGVHVGIYLHIII